MAHSRKELQEVSSRVYPDLERVPGKQNWVEKTGGLPSYIERIAKHLHYEKGKPIGTAIATAVETTRRWCSTGKNWNGGDLKPATRAKACKAAASWEAKKAKSKAKTAAKKIKESAEIQEARQIIEANGALPCDDMVAKELAGLVSKRLMVAEGMLPALREPKTVGKAGLVKSAIELLEAELSDSVKLGMVGGPAANPRDMKKVADLMEAEVEELRALAESLGADVKDDKPWEKESPKKGKGKKLSPAAKKKAKARAKKAGRKYPNLVDNMAAAKEMEEGIQRGHRGEPIKRIQQQVEMMEAYIGDAGADGVYGYHTERGVKAVQRRQGLVADGIVGPKTAAMLDEQAPILEEGFAGYSSDKGNAPVNGKTTPAPMPKRRDGKSQPSDPDFEKKHPRGRGGQWIQKGAQGAAVTGIQRDLGMENASGEYDQRTEQAVRRFQQQNDLQVDGVVGSQTAAAMMDSEAPVGQITDEQRQFLAERSKRPAGRPLNMREANWGKPMDVSVPDWSKTGVRKPKSTTDKGAIAGWLDMVGKAALEGDTAALADMFGEKTWPEEWDADIDEMLYEGDEDRLEAMRKVIRAIRESNGSALDQQFFENALASGMDDDNEPEEMEEADIAGSGTAEAATDGNVVEAPPGPPNLRESRGGDANCGSCLSYEGGKCVAHSTSVEPGQICDDWKAGEVAEASLRGAARTGLRSLRDVKVGLPELGDRKTARPIYRLPDGTFAPKGMGAILRPGEEVSIDGKRGRVAADGKTIEVPGETAKKVAPEAVGMDSPELDKEIEKDARLAVGRGLRGMDSPETDKEIEQDAKRAVGRGMRSPETDKQIEQDAKAAVGRGMRSPEEPFDASAGANPGSEGWEVADRKLDEATDYLKSGYESLSSAENMVRNAVGELPELDGWPQKGLSLPELRDQLVASREDAPFGSLSSINFAIEDLDAAEESLRNGITALRDPIMGEKFADTTEVDTVADDIEAVLNGEPPSNSTGNLVDDIQRLSSEAQSITDPRGMASPETDREIEQDAKRAVGRGMRSPTVDDFPIGSIVSFHYREGETGDAKVTGEVVDHKRGQVYVSNPNFGESVVSPDKILGPPLDADNSIYKAENGAELAFGNEVWTKRDRGWISPGKQPLSDTEMYQKFQDDPNYSGASGVGMASPETDAEIEKDARIAVGGGMRSPTATDAEALAMTIGFGGEVMADGKVYKKIGGSNPKAGLPLGIWQSDDGSTLRDGDIGQLLLNDPSSKVMDAGDLSGMDSPNFRAPSDRQLQGLTSEQFDRLFDLRDALSRLPNNIGVEINGVTWEEFTERLRRGTGTRTVWSAIRGTDWFKIRDRSSTDWTRKDSTLDIAWGAMNDPDSRIYRMTEEEEQKFLSDAERERLPEIEAALASAKESLGSGMDSPSARLAASPGDTVRLRPNAVELAKGIGMDFGGDDGEAIVLNYPNDAGMVNVQRSSDGKVLEVAVNSLMTPSGFEIGMGRKRRGMESPETDREIEQDAKVAVGRGMRSPARETIPKKGGSQVIINGELWQKELLSTDWTPLPASGWRKSTDQSAVAFEVPVRGYPVIYDLFDADPDASVARDGFAGMDSPGGPSEGEWVTIESTGDMNGVTGKVVGSFSSEGRDFVEVEYEAYDMAGTPGPITVAQVRLVALVEADKVTKAKSPREGMSSPAKKVTPGGWQKMTTGSTGGIRVGGRRYGRDIEATVSKKEFEYRPAGMDRWDGPGIEAGRKVRLTKLNGAPPPGTMGQYHIVDSETGEFLGMVNGSSLVKPGSGMDSPAVADAPSAANSIDGKKISREDVMGLVEEARSVAQQAFDDAKPPAMIVEQRANAFDDKSPVIQEWYVPDGPSGFAWMIVKPATARTARVLKEMGIASSWYQGGLYISSWKFADAEGPATQSLSRKQAAISAAAEVLNRVDNISIQPMSRMDSPGRPDYKPTYPFPGGEEARLDLLRRTGGAKGWEDVTALSRVVEGAADWLEPSLEDAPNMDSVQRAKELLDSPLRQGGEALLGVNGIGTTGTTSGLMDARQEALVTAVSRLRNILPEVNDLSVTPSSNTVDNRAALTEELRSIVADLNNSNPTYLPDSEWEQMGITKPSAIHHPLGLPFSWRTGMESPAADTVRELLDAEGGYSMNLNSADLSTVDAAVPGFTGMGAGGRYSPDETMSVITGLLTADIADDEGWEAAYSLGRDIISTLVDDDMEAQRIADTISMGMSSPVEEVVGAVSLNIGDSIKMADGEFVEIINLAPTSSPDKGPFGVAIWTEGDDLPIRAGLGQRVVVMRGGMDSPGFRNATSRRVQAMTPEQFDAWSELNDFLNRLPIGSPSEGDRSDITVNGQRFSRRTKPFSRRQRFTPGFGWEQESRSGAPDKFRESEDLAYNIMLDPEAKLEVWNPETGQYEERDIPNKGILAASGMSSPATLSPAQEAAQRNHNRLRSRLAYLHDRLYTSKVWDDKFDYDSLRARDEARAEYVEIRNELGLDYGMSSPGMESPMLDAIKSVLSIDPEAVNAGFDMLDRATVSGLPAETALLGAVAGLGALGAPSGISLNQSRLGEGRAYPSPTPDTVLPIPAAARFISAQPTGLAGRDFADAPAGRLYHYREAPLPLDESVARGVSNIGPERWMFVSEDGGSVGVADSAEKAVAAAQSEGMESPSRPAAKAWEALNVEGVSDPESAAQKAIEAIEELPDSQQRFLKPFVKMVRDNPDSEAARLNLAGALLVIPHRDSRFAKLEAFYPLEVITKFVDASPKVLSLAQAVGMASPTDDRLDDRFEYGGQITTRREILRDLLRNDDIGVGPDARARIDRYIQGLERTQGARGIGGMDSPEMTARQGRDGLGSGSSSAADSLVNMDTESLRRMVQTGAPSQRTWAQAELDRRDALGMASPDTSTGGYIETGDDTIEGYEELSDRETEVSREIRELYRDLRDNNDPEFEARAVYALRELEAEQADLLRRIASAEELFNGEAEVMSSPGMASPEQFPSSADDLRSLRDRYIKARDDANDRYGYNHDLTRDYNAAIRSLDDRIRNAESGGMASPDDGGDARPPRDAARAGGSLATALDDLRSAEQILRDGGKDDRDYISFLNRVDAELAAAADDDPRVEVVRAALPFGADTDEAHDAGVFQAVRRLENLMGPRPEMGMDSPSAWTRSETYTKFNEERLAELVRQGDEQAQAELDRRGALSTSVPENSWRGDPGEMAADRWNEAQMMSPSANGTQASYLAAQMNRRELMKALGITPWQARDIPTAELIARLEAQRDS